MRTFLASLGITALISLPFAFSGCKSADSMGGPHSNGGAGGGGLGTPYIPTACETYCGEASKLGGQAGGCDPTCGAKCDLLRKERPACATELDAQLACYVQNFGLCQCAPGYFLDCSAAATACAGPIAAYATCAAQQAPPSTSSGGSPHVGTSIGELNANQLLVSLATYPRVCGQPDDTTCPAKKWEVTFGVDLGRLHPGLVLSLGEVLGLVSGVEPWNNGCSPFSSTYLDGTVEVLALDATTVTLRLAGTAPPPGETTGSADGDYVVDLCAPMPDPGKPLQQVLATTDGSGSLTLHLTNAPSTCADPDASLQLCSSEQTDLTIRLPVAMQAVGTYPLDGLGAYEDCFPYSTSCVCDGRTFWNGTIDIKSIDAGGLAFDLSGTDGIIWRHPNVDGSYVATRCP